MALLLVRLGASRMQQDVHQCLSESGRVVSEGSRSGTIFGSVSIFMKTGDVMGSNTLKTNRKRHGQGNVDGRTIGVVLSYFVGVVFALSSRC